MDDVKRYSKTYNGGLSWDVQEAPDGEYVIYDDYASLRARLEAVEKERDEVKRSRLFYVDEHDKEYIRAERAEAALATARREALEMCRDIAMQALTGDADGRDIYEQIDALANEAKT